MFKQELSAVAEWIDGIIRNDSFPDNIEPEFLQEAVKSYPYRGGKRLRPALLLWTCGLLGGSLDQAIYAAAAVELYHNWTLVHDDIIDNDSFRRGQPTTHTELADYSAKKYGLVQNRAETFGRDFAILAGDIQQGWATEMLLKSLDLGASPELVLALSRRLQQLVNRQLISGEALDVEFSYRHPEEISSEEVERMQLGKTGILLQFAAEAGAMLALNQADFNHESVAKAGQFASLAGLAFQLRDDWLGIFGDEQSFGKPIGSDMSESKPTLLLISALEHLSGPDKDQLRSLLGRPNYSPAEIDEIRTLLKSSGAEAAVNHKAAGYGARAIEILESFPANNYRKLLKEWCYYLIDRQV